MRLLPPYPLKRRVQNPSEENDMGWDINPGALCCSTCIWTNVSLSCAVLSCSVMSDSFRPQGLEAARLLCPWDSPSKNTGVGCHFLLQGIFQTQGLNPGLLHCRQILYHQPPGKLHTKHKENYKGLIITICRCCWGKFWTRCKKTKKPNCHF